MFWPNPQTNPLYKRVIKCVCVDQSIPRRRWRRIRRSRRFPGTAVCTAGAPRCRRSRIRPRSRCPSCSRIRGYPDKPAHR